MFKKSPRNKMPNISNVKEKGSKKVYVYLTGEQRYCPTHHKLRLFYFFEEEGQGAQLYCSDCKIPNEALCLPQMVDQVQANIAKFGDHYSRAKLIVKKTYDSLPEVVLKSKKILKQLLNEHIKGLQEILRQYKQRLEQKME